MKDAKKNGTLVEPTTMRLERLLPGPIERVREYRELPDDVKAKLVEADRITPIIPKFAPPAPAGWHTPLDLLEGRTRGEPSFDVFDRFEGNLTLYAAPSSS
jgi:hypothetical protein